ncbi:MAG: hypothetical protein ACRD3H_12975 [Terriglobales bacterium]
MDSKATPIEAINSQTQIPPPVWLRFLVPSVADLMFIILLLAMTGGILAPRLLGDASIGWHIRNGELMLRTHAITRTDPFSVTMSGQTWYAWEWLYDIVIAGIHHWIGLNGVVLFTAVIIAATFALTLRLSLRRGGNLPVTVVLLALSLGAAMIHLLARPHVVSWLLTVVWFQLLDESEAGSKSTVDATGRRLWWLPVLMLLWANVHAGFVVGFVLLGLYLASSAIGYFRCRLEQGQEQEFRRRRLRRLGLVTLASLGASLINPYGYRLHLHVYQYLSSRWLMNHIDEFLSPNFHGVAQQCFVAILLITIVALAIVGKKLSLSRILVLLFAAYSGLYASRSLPVSSLLLTLLVAPLLTEAIEEVSSRPDLALLLRDRLLRFRSFGVRMARTEAQFRGHAWPLIAVFAGVLACAHGGRLGAYQWMDAHFDASRFPVQAADAILQRGLREPIFCPDSWGGYLIYRLYPQNEVFVDDRHDFYGKEFLKEYLQTVRLAPEWKRFLNEKRVNWVLVPAKSALANMLLETPQWRVVYRDGTAVLFERIS